MKIFVTGVTGFVGRALARELFGRGHDIIGLVRPGTARDRLPGLPLEIVEGDITRPDSLRGRLAGCQALVHAAGRLGSFAISPDTYEKLHVAGTENVLVEALAAGVGRMLVVSSPGVLGPTGGAPREESDPYAPTNPYERSKAAGERVARRFAAEGSPVVIVRPEFLYGPGDHHVLGLFQAIQNSRFFLINGGRSYCHPTFIDDGVRGMTLAFERGLPGEIYHIAGPESVTMRVFTEGIAAAVGAAPPRLSLPRPLALATAAGLEAIGRLAGWSPPLTRSAVDFFSTSYRFSWAKAANELGYRPEVDLAEGLARTVAWYRARGLLA